MTTPIVTLNNGVTLPAIGLGVFQTPPEETTAAVIEALKQGYRHIDTAAAYGNEKEVGQAIKDSGFPREDIVVETKIWISDYGRDLTRHGFEKSLAKLGLEYIDIVLLHQPLTVDFERTIGAYQALEELLGEGFIRAVGVSNFQEEDLQRLLAATDVVPAINQIEVHPYFQETDLQRLHKELGILTQAWSPLGGITSYSGASTVSFEGHTLVEIAQTHDKTTAQVMLRWHIQQGRSAIPKSVKPARIAENFDVFDFELSEQELAAIDALDTGVRSGPEPASITLENYGMPIPEA